MLSMAKTINIRKSRWWQLPMANILYHEDVFVQFLYDKYIDYYT